MELKQRINQGDYVSQGVLIVPYGIETRDIGR